MLTPTESWVRTEPLTHFKLSNIEWRVAIGFLVEGLLPQTTVDAEYLKEVEQELNVDYDVPKLAERTVYFSRPHGKDLKTLKQSSVESTIRLASAAVDAAIDSFASFGSLQKLATFVAHESAQAIYLHEYPKAHEAAVIATRPYRLARIAGATPDLSKALQEAHAVIAA